MNIPYTIYKADCFDILKELSDNSVDLILADLPYGTTSLEWDKILPFNKLWDCYDRLVKDTGNIVLFASGKFVYDLYESNKNNFRYKIIWKKNVPTGMSGAKYAPMKYYEEILVFKKSNSKVSDITYNPQMKDRVGIHKDCYNYDHYCGKSSHVEYDKIKKKYDPNKVQPSDIIEFNVVPNRSGKLHPTEKPVDLLRYLIRTYSNEGDVVLDNCMGSGSTGIGCLRENRKFIGVELNNDFYDISENRLKEELKVISDKLF